MKEIHLSNHSLWIKTNYRLRKMSFAKSDLVLEGSSYDIWIYGYDKYSMASKICPFPIWDVLMALPTKNKLN